MHNTLRRQTISDNLITADILQKLIEYTLNNVQDVMDFSQVEIVKLLLPKKLSNITIARIINELLPQAHATKGSVASLIRHIKSKDSLLDELLKEIGDV